jgi:hypothetical protein
MAVVLKSEEVDMHVRWPFDFGLAACAQDERVLRFNIDAHQELS